MYLDSKKKSYALELRKLTYELNTSIDMIAELFGISKKMFWVAVNTSNTTASFENSSRAIRQCQLPLTTSEFLKKDPFLKSNK